MEKNYSLIFSILSRKIHPPRGEQQTKTLKEMRLYKNKEFAQEIFFRLNWMIFHALLVFETAHNK
jgi:hypothetical protein